eukprot:1961508-Alexandrium_andersonii.AAC.1
MPSAGSRRRGVLELQQQFQLGLSPGLAAKRNGVRGASSVGYFETSARCGVQPARARARCPACH